MMNTNGLLYVLLSTSAIKPTTDNSNVLTIKQQPFDGDFKIKFGSDSLTLRSTIAFWFIQTTPFDNINVFSVNKDKIVCSVKWDICTCQTCPVFKRLIEFESAVVIKFPERILKNIILFQ